MPKRYANHRYFLTEIERMTNDGIRTGCDQAARLGHDAKRATKPYEYIGREHPAGDHHVGEAERENRQKRYALGDDLIDWMNTGGRQPIQLLDAVMDRVKFPQRRKGVEGAVRQIKSQVGQQQRFDEL